METTQEKNSETIEVLTDRDMIPKIQKISDKWIQLYSLIDNQKETESQINSQV